MASPSISTTTRVGASRSWIGPLSLEPAPARLDDKRETTRRVCLLTREVCRLTDDISCHRCTFKTKRPPRRLANMPLSEQMRERMDLSCSRAGANQYCHMLYRAAHARVVFKENRPISNALTGDLRLEVAGEDDLESDHLCIP